MVEYLLGALPPGETERLDELSVTDDEFAERLQAVENDLVDAYVRGELTGQMLSHFQAFYLASPRRREKVQFAHAFRGVPERAAFPRGATEISRGAPDSRESDIVSVRSGWRRVFTVPRHAWQWGFTAAAVVFVTVAGWVLENRRLGAQRDAALAYGRSVEHRTKQLEAQLAKGSPVPEQKPEVAPGPREPAKKAAPDSPVILAFNLAPQMRGTSRIPTVVIAAGVDYITLQLELESAEYTVWRARLRPASGRESVRRSGRLSAYASEDSQIVPVSFPASVLEANLYVVELAGIRAGGSEDLVASYPFRVIRK
jgi:hypothetical protein